MTKITDKQYHVLSNNTQMLLSLTKDSSLNDCYIFWNINSIHNIIVKNGSLNYKFTRLVEDDVLSMDSKELPIDLLELNLKLLKVNVHFLDGLSIDGCVSASDLSIILRTKQTGTLSNFKGALPIELKHYVLYLRYKAERNMKIALFTIFFVISILLMAFSEILPFLFNVEFMDYTINGLKTLSLFFGVFGLFQAAKYLNKGVDLIPYLQFDELI